MKKRALVSVSDKTNIVTFVKGLVDCDFEIISTGGTKKILEEHGVKCIGIEEVTGFPEILDGRVKTLHPKVHGGLLAIRNDESHVEQVNKHKIDYIDLVCVNLYPFKETISKVNVEFEDAIENIDIGGPSMLRSAAKNHNDVTVVTNVYDYDVVLQELKELGNTKLETRRALAAKVFRLTAHYDAIIAEYLTAQVGEEDPDLLTITFEKDQSLRYGENPHQKASFYSTYSSHPYSIVNCEQLHGKELSYNNIQDTNAALNIASEFDYPVVVALKHMNPCGVGIGENVNEAWDNAYASDPVSIFGGIIATNQTVTKEVAEKMSKIFLEVIIAPAFDEEAQEILMRKKNIRLLLLNMENKDYSGKEYKTVNGGLLVQDIDTLSITEEDLEVVTNTGVSDEDIKQLLFAWKCVKHVKSNAILLAKDSMTVGVGPGQSNRVGAAKIALEQAGEKAKDSYMASDAFFPMDDTVRLAAEYGVKAIIQPGGSIKDQDSIDACNELGIAMVFTKVRHFKH